VLFSDIHIAADPKTVARGVNMTDHLRQAVGEALALGKARGGPSMAIVNGDCAYNNGETVDYAAVVGLVRPLREAGLPVHLNLGNHDNRERFWGAIPAEERTGTDGERPVEGKQVMVVETPRVDWVMLDSLERTRSTPGLLGEGQLKWLSGVLDEPKRKGKAVIVMVHHQPQMPATEQIFVPTPTAGKPAPKPEKISGIKDTRELMDVLVPRRNVKALVFGHTHAWSHRKMESGLHLVNLPTVAYVFNPVQPSGWVDCVVGEGGAKFTLNCLDKKYPKHGEVVEADWRV
jgi:hypothetical protein